MKHVSCSFFEKGKSSMQRQQNTNEKKKPEQNVKGIIIFIGFFFLKLVIYSACYITNHVTISTSIILFPELFSPRVMFANLHLHLIVSPCLKFS